MRHRKSAQGIADLLDMLNVISPGKAPKSKHLLLKALCAHIPRAEKHFYCLDCTGHLGRSTQEPCENCEQDIDMVSCPFFLVMPLKEQIERVLAQQNLKWLPQRSSVIGDVADGIEHTRLSANFSSCDISLLWNTDGMSFEKAAFDIWKFFNWTLHCESRICSCLPLV